MDFEFSVKVADPALVSPVKRLVEPFVDGGRAERGFAIVGRDPEYELRDGVRPLASALNREAVLSALVVETTGRVVASTSDLVLHAAAAEVNGVGFVFLGPSGAGKTTLVAALVHSGFRYLTDEAVAVTAGLRIRPYPKALSIDHASKLLLTRFAPDLTRELQPDARGLGPVPVAVLSNEAPAPPTPVRFLLGVSRSHTGRTELVPCSRAAGVSLLAANAFNFERLGARGLDIAIGAARASACYHLFTGDLAETCAALRGLCQSRHPEVLSG